jgi:hypothetical protein
VVAFGPVGGLLRAFARPLGYLMFALALLALSAAARLLGERDELGFFTGRLAGMLWRYPEVTRPGVQAAWLAWAVLFGLALSPADPIPSWWDEFVLAGLALFVLSRRLYVARRAGH